MMGHAIFIYLCARFFIVQNFNYCKCSGRMSSVSGAVRVKIFHFLVDAIFCQCFFHFRLLFVSRLDLARFPGSLF